MKAKLVETNVKQGIDNYLYTLHKESDYRNNLIFNISVTLVILITISFVLYFRYINKDKYNKINDKKKMEYLTKYIFLDNKHNFI